MCAQAVRGACRAAGLAFLVLFLGGASCDRTSSGPSNPPPKAPATRVQQQSPAGVDLGKLDDARREQFAGLLDTLESPCGKAHSLKTSLDSDPSCKRAPFAARYVVRLLEADMNAEEITEAYGRRYANRVPHTMAIDEAPYEGVPSAPIVLVEYFDYGCPHCKSVQPALEDLLVEFPSEAVLYYKNFPLAGNPDGVPAAMAAVAAQRQGKFKQMHRLLFSRQGSHSMSDLQEMAKELGLDMARFEEDMADSALRERVNADRESGEALEIKGTPMLYVNGREYTDMISTEYLSDWIREELAVASGT